MIYVMHKVFLNHRSHDVKYMFKTEIFSASCNFYPFGKKLGTRENDIALNFDFNGD